MQNGRKVKSLVLKVANKRSRGQEDLLLLQVNEDKVRAEVKYDYSVSMGEAFPHIYGPLNVDAIEKVISLNPENDGGFLLPKELKE